MLKLVERLGHLEIADRLIVDGDPLEERLVEQPLLVGVSRDIGGLDAVGHGQRRKNVFPQHLVVRAQSLDQFFGCDPLPTNPCLLFYEQLFGDRVGVVSVEQLLLLVPEFHKIGLSPRQSRSGLLTTLIEVPQHRRFDATTHLVIKLHPLKQLLDACLDRLQSLVRQIAFAALCAHAGVVLVDTAIAAIAAVDQ